MSFLRHREIYPSDGGKTLTGRAPAHRLDEFPTGYSWAGCSPAEPASASPASLILLRLQSFVYDVSANGNLSPILVSHHRGAAHYETPKLHESSAGSGPPKIYHGTYRAGRGPGPLASHHPARQPAANRLLRGRRPHPVPAVADPAHPPMVGPHRGLLPDE